MLPWAVAAEGWGWTGGFYEVGYQFVRLVWVGGGGRENMEIWWLMCSSADGSRMRVSSTFVL